MTKLHTVNGMQVRVYVDHNPPHFHIVAADAQARVAIGSMTVVVGRIPDHRIRAALDWAKSNRHLIVAEWNRLNPDKPTI